MDIQIDTVKTRKTGEEILEITNNLTEEISKLKSVVENISRSWIGGNASSYVNAMNQGTISELEKLNSILIEYGEYLRDVPEAYVILDEIYSSKNIEGE